MVMGSGAWVFKSLGKSQNFRRPFLQLFYSKTKQNNNNNKTDMKFRAPDLTKPLEA